MVVFERGGWQILNGDVSGLNYFCRPHLKNPDCPHQFGWRTAARRLTCAMRLHDRYLFRELLTPLACCLGGFLVFWITFFFFKQLATIQEKKLNLFDTAEYCAASLPAA